MAIAFADGNPLDVWDSGFAGLGNSFRDAGLGEIVFASPFLATIPGTDTYTDQLW